jgi:hypothetical protein
MIVSVRQRGPFLTRREMSKASKATCDDCYFRRAGLCALSPETPCPTFRAETRGALMRPRQPQLVPRSLGEIAGRAAA